MCNLIYILQIHSHICLNSDGAAISGKINSFISILPDDNRFSVTLQFWDSPSHAKEAVNFVHVFTDFIKHLFLYNKRFIVSDIQRLLKFHFTDHILQCFNRAFEGFISSLCLCLNCHILFTTCATRTFPEMCVCQASDQRSYYKLNIHCFLFHNLKYLFSPFFVIPPRINFNYIF